jgi:hypothetical protein
LTIVQGIPDDIDLNKVLKAWKKVTKKINIFRFSIVMDLSKQTLKIMRII